MPHFPTQQRNFLLALVPVQCRSYAMLKLIRRLLLVWVALAAASSANAGDLFGAVQASSPSSLDRLSMADYRLPWLALAETPLGSFSAAYTSVLVGAPKQVTLPRNATPEAANFNDWTDKRIYTSGEIGFLYGRSTGKHGFETEQGYIFGTAGNDNIQISVGAAYQEWSGRGARHH